MEAAVRPLVELDAELRIFPDWSKGREAWGRFRLAALASVGLHILAVTMLFSLPAGRGSKRDAAEILASLRNPTRLVAPPAELTQKAPNRGKVGKEFELADLLPRPRLFSPPPVPSSTNPAAAAPGHPVPALPEPPRIEAQSGALGQTPLAVERGLPVPPPQIQAEERPKLAFESLAQGRSPEPGRGALRAPGGSVAEIGRELARAGGSGGLIVGDIGLGVGGIGEAINLPPAPGKSGSTLELLSDPQGVDFRPYLIMVLSSVRRNWHAVIPESAKLGRRGKTAIQFAINKDGRVPKLVIASPSGTEALDRAAVAGISASNPFPPLPGEYRGDQIRLQLTFLYNMAR